MNRTGIGWTEFTWNPIFGCYGPGGTAEKPKRCWYCYAHELTNRNLWKCEKCRAFIPHFHRERLEKLSPRQKPKTIFVGSMSDMWGDWVPAEWIEPVLQVIRACPQHTFLALTKNPKRYSKYLCINEIPSNLWCGITIATQNDYNRASEFIWEHEWDSIETPFFISFEPLLENIWKNNRRFGINMRIADCIIIGPLNKRGHGPVTKKEWVERIMDIAKSADVPVILKNACEKIGFTRDFIEAHQQAPWRVR